MTHHTPRRHLPALLAAMLCACTATGDDPTGDTDPGTDDGHATDDAPATGGSADDAPADDGADPTDASGSSDGNGTGDDGDTGDDAGALACTDQMILDLGLVQGVVSGGSACASLQLRGMK